MSTSAPVPARTSETDRSRSLASGGAPPPPIRRSILEPIVVYQGRGLRLGTKTPPVRFVEQTFGAVAALRSPRGITELQALVERDILDGVRTIVTCGGDGLVNHVGQSLAGTGAAILPLPGGTANDFSRELGWAPLPRHRVRYRVDSLDCIRVNGRLLLTVGGSGPGARVVRAMNGGRSRSRLFRSIASLAGRWTYVALVCVEAFRWRFHRAGLEVIGPSIPIVRPSYLLICNQTTLAGSFKLATGSRNDDGAFELVHFLPGAPWDAVRYWIRALFGLPGGEGPWMVSRVTDHVRIAVRDHGPGEIFGDGELFEPASDGSYRVELDPAALRVVRRA